MKHTKYFIVVSYIFLIAFSEKALSCTSCGGGHEDFVEQSKTEREAEMASLSVIKETDATHIALESGSFSDPKTWGGVVPDANAIVFIPPGITVGVEGTVKMCSLLLKGTLRINQSAFVSLNTLNAEYGSFLDIQPKESDLVQVKFSEENCKFPFPDPKKLSLGFVGMGKVLIKPQIEEKTSYVDVLDGKIGSFEILLASDTSGWKAGDTLLLPSATRWDLPSKPEFMTIKSIPAPNRIVLTSAIEREHSIKIKNGSGQWETKYLPIANITKNIRFLGVVNPQSLDGKPHLMLCHNPDIKIIETSFVGFGKTSKNHRVTDIEIINGKVTKGTDANPRGRYGLHFHRANKAGWEDAIIVKNNYLSDSEGWGYVNHSSKVHFTGNVAYNVKGSSFVAEVGNEQGFFMNNLSIQGIPAIPPPIKEGSSITVKEADDQQNFGIQIAYSLASALVVAKNNISIGNKTAIFSSNAWAQNLAKIPTKLFPNQKCVANLSALEKAHFFPQQTIQGHTAYSSEVGAGIYGFNRTEPVDYDCYNQISGIVVYGGKISNNYNKFIRIENSRVYTETISVGSNGALNRLNVSDQGVSSNNDFVSDVRISGLEIAGGVFMASTISAKGSNSATRTTINGAKIPLQIELRPVSLKSVTRPSWVLTDVETTGSISLNLLGNVSSLFGPYGKVTIDGKNVYPLNVLEDSVPFKLSASSDAPLELQGLTNGEIYKKFGIAIAGIIPEKNSIQSSSLKIKGVIGNNPETAHPATPAQTFTNQQTQFLVKILSSTGLPVEIGKFDLKPNRWNIFPIALPNGKKTAVLVRHDNKVPVFSKPPKDFEMSKEKFEKGALAQQRFYFKDENINHGVPVFYEAKVKLKGLPVQKDEKGREFVWIVNKIPAFCDPAGNCRVIPPLKGWIL